ncbi:MAG: 30S ribosomal protein S6 [Mycoplasmatales bacterium]
MKKYEVGFIVRSTIDQEAATAVADRLKAIYTENDCSVLEEVNLGVKELAYTIDKKYTSGYYTFLIVDATHEANLEFERICRISEDVIRFMVIDVDNVAGSTLDIIRK